MDENFHIKVQILKGFAVKYLPDKHAFSVHENFPTFSLSGTTHVLTGKDI